MRKRQTVEEVKEIAEINSELFKKKKDLNLQLPQKVLPLP